MRLVLACLAVLVAAPVSADATANLEAAQRSLREAKVQLRGAGGGFEGHRQNAIERVNQAMTQVDKALAIARRQQEQKKVEQIDKKIDQLEQRKDEIESR